MEAQKVMFSISELKIITAKHILDEAGIYVHTIDKRDSSHLVETGSIELYVDSENAEEARALLVEEGVL